MFNLLLTVAIHRLAWGYELGEVQKVLVENYEQTPCTAAYIACAAQVVLRQEGQHS